MCSSTELVGMTKTQETSNGHLCRCKSVGQTHSFQMLLVLQCRSCWFSSVSAGALLTWSSHTAVGVGVTALHSDHWWLFRLVTDITEQPLCWQSSAGCILWAPTGATGRRWFCDSSGIAETPAGATSAVTPEVRPKSYYPFSSPLHKVVFYQASLRYLWVTELTCFLPSDLIKMFLQLF